MKQLKKTRKPKAPITLERFLIMVLRRASRTWPPKNQAFALARVNRGEYKCKACEKIFKQKEVQADHISPVIPLTGFDTVEGFIKRLLCDVHGYQILCKPCHLIKTKRENDQRKVYRKKKREWNEKRNKR